MYKQSFHLWNICSIGTEKYFQILNGAYEYKKINYQEFREYLQKIDTSNYNEQILNSGKFLDLEISFFISSMSVSTIFVSSIFETISPRFIIWPFLSSTLSSRLL